MFDPHQILTRRSLMLGAVGIVGAGGLLGACGGSSGSSSGSGGSGTSAGTGPVTDGFVVVQRYPSGQTITPGDVRLAVSLADSSASLLTEGPEVLTGFIRNEQGEAIATVAAERRGAGLGVPYWSIEATIPSRGLYELDLDGVAGDPTPFLLFDADEIAIPTVGRALPAFDTPTTADARGVDPICTRLDGACPFHDVTLTEALALGKPVVYLVGTPAHCQTATCGPGLEFLIAAAEQYADVATFVHAEVYADPEATAVAPAVTALALEYEPVIFVTDAAGTITRRIDIVWDATELETILAAALG